MEPWKQVYYPVWDNVYLSAAVNWMDYLQDRDLIVAGSRVNLWGNALSLLAHDAMALPFAPNAGRSILWLYSGLVLGGVGSGLLSQLLRSRRKTVGLFLALTVVGCVAYFLKVATTLTGFYALCVAMGFAIGYWAVFITIAAEQFGTNIRATATTTAPNFVRGAVVPMTWAFQWFRDGAGLGVVGGGIAVGVIVMVLAVISLAGLTETFGKDLDYIEP